MEKALFFIYIMLGCTIYSLGNAVGVFIFYSDLCVPVHIPIEVDSFLRMIDHMVTYELWLWPLYHYFWPTTTHV